MMVGVIYIPLDQKYSRITLQIIIHIQYWLQYCGYRDHTI